MSCPLRLISYEPIVLEIQSNVRIERIPVPVLMKGSVDKFIPFGELEPANDPVVYLTNGLPEGLGVFIRS